MKLRTVALDRGGLLGLSVLVLYVWLAPSYFVDGDNAEFAALSQLGGAAHPPGYPLYVVWLRATSWLPGATPAHTAAIATAILGAAAIIVLHAACRAWGARPLAATLACAMFAAAPVVLTMHTEAEVFALNDLLVGAIVWLAAPRGPLQGRARASMLGLVAGLALANQLTCVVVAPLGIYGIVRAVRERGWTTLPCALGGLVLGLTPYLYLLVAPDTVISWGKDHDLADVLARFLREDYSGPTSFLAHGIDVSPWTSIGALLATLARGWLWAPLVIGLGTLGWRCAKRRDDDSRVAWAMLAASFLLAGPALAALFNAPPEGLGLYIVQRFHILPTLLLAVPVAVGLDALGSRLPAIRVADFVAPTLGLAATAALSLPHVWAAHTPTVERYVRGVLRVLPERAVVFTHSDELYFGAIYLRAERPDVQVVGWATLVLDWYRRRVEAAGIRPDFGPGSVTVRIARTLFAQHRPVFIDDNLAGQLKMFAMYPYATSVRVLPPDTPQPSLDDVFAQNRAAYEQFDMTEERPDAPWPQLIHDRYAATWREIAHAYEREGRAPDAARALDVARQVGPAP